MKKDSGVSSVLGEVLMIGLVLILVPIVTINLMNQLPEDRIPTVTIIGANNYDKETNILIVTFYHKGGDYLKKEDISVMVRVKDELTKVNSEKLLRKIDLTFDNPDSSVIDLGNSFSTPEIIVNERNIVIVSVIVKNTVIYPGEKFYER